MSSAKTLFPNLSAINNENNENNENNDNSL